MEKHLVLMKGFQMETNLVQLMASLTAMWLDVWKVAMMDYLSEMR
jgi:hypothetical protein